MKKKTAKAKPARSKEEKLIDAMVAFLETKGWKLAVAGGMQIQSRGGLRYSLAINFTGTHPDHSLKERSQ